MTCRVSRACALVVLSTLTLFALSDTPSGADPSLSAKISPLGAVFQSRAGAKLAFEAPDRFALDSKGNLIVLDLKLSTVFKLDSKGRVLWSARSAAPYVKRFDLLADVAVDATDQVWVLDAGHKVLCLFTPQGQVVRTVALERPPRRFTVLRSGELVVNVGQSSALFDVYSPSGKLRRSFGERERYASDTSDFELNTGNMAAGPHGEVYISLASPPVIRAYDAGKGKLLWQTEIPFFPPLKAPDIKTTALGNGQMAASFEYQLASLDLVVDRQGRLLCLVGGMARGLARQGSRRLDLFSPRGQRLGSVTLPVAAARLGSHQKVLYLLADRDAKPLLGRYSLDLAGRMAG